MRNGYILRSTALLALLALLASLSGCITNHARNTPASEIRVMTFNIRNGVARDGKNRWDLRKQFVCDVIRDEGSHVIGVQEAYYFQIEVFKKKLPQYGLIGEGRDGKYWGEYSAILYLKERFTVSESGTFWLSETPSKSSKSWGSACKRICTWAQLTDKKSHQSFYVYNTHLDHKSQNARENGIKLIVERIAARAHKAPIIFMGDLNAGEDNKVITYLTGKSDMEKTRIQLVDSFRVLHPDEKVVGTFSAFNGKTDGKKIDYIFVSPKIKVLSAAIVRTNRAGVYPSDHYPVTALLNLTQTSSPTR